MTNVKDEFDLQYDEYDKAVKYYLSLDYFQLKQQIELIQRELKPILKKLRFMESAMRMREI